MTDRVPPKPKKPTKDKDAKATGPRLVDKDIKSGIGHNGAPHTGEKNPEAIKCLEELMGYQEKKKAIATAERDIRNRLKSEFGILASSVAREVSLRKLDPDVRVQVETNHDDFKKMIGYQPSLCFVNGQATLATQKAVEAQEKSMRNTEPARVPQPEPEEKGFNVDDNDGEDDSSVITREG